MVKKILILSLLILSGCTGSSDPSAPPPPPPPIESVSNAPIDVYMRDGGTGIHLIQTDGVTLSTIIPTIQGTTYSAMLGTCALFYDISTSLVTDPTERLYWMSQPVTIEVDTDMVTCDTYSQCVLDGFPAMNGTVAEVKFKCAPV